MKKIIIFLLILLPIISLSQMRMMGPSPFMMPTERIFWEAVSVPSGESGKSKIMVSVKAPYEFLVFTKSPERTSKDFIGSFDISIEIFDKNDNYIDRIIKQEIIELYSEEKKFSRDKFYESSFSFNITPGEYKITCEFSDRESNKNQKKEFKSFKAKNFSEKNISDILFLPPYADSTVSSNFLSSIQFGENCILYTECSGFNPGEEKLKLTLYKMTERKRDSVFSLIILPEHIYRKTFNKSNTGNKNIQDIFLVKVPLRTDTLEIARYEASIETVSGAKKMISKKEFEIIWHKMPFSLRDFDLAQKQLKLITREDEFDELKSGSKSIQREKFLEFWRKRDPTPTTAYNEIMTEFFKRVDFSIMNYSTVSAPDGSVTDRGRYYILYGKPDNIERRLIPNEAPYEIWTYSKFNKKYIFSDDSRQGNYKLVSIESI